MSKSSANYTTGVNGILSVVPAALKTTLFFSVTVKNTTEEICTYLTKSPDSDISKPVQIKLPNLHGELPSEVTENTQFYRNLDETTL